MGSDLVKKALAGDIRAAARLMRLADDRSAGYDTLLKEIWPLTGNATIIGITGAPGAGKSTLTDALITHYRSIGKSVGVVAIDPSSPFTGGAILGDRIRMSSHSTDPEVFIRSLGTRGHLGGLSVSAMDIVAIMDAIGKDIVIVETVGVGQDEVEIAAVADTCVVVTLPGMGDDIQAIKAGILEVADIFVVNKADRDGVERTVKDLEMMMSLSGMQSQWTPPVLRTVALKNQGVTQLAEQIDAHKKFSESTNIKEQKRKARLFHAAQGIIKEQIFSSVFTQERLNNEISSQNNNPYMAVEILWNRFIKS